MYPRNTTNSPPLVGGSASPITNRAPRVVISTRVKAVRSEITSPATVSPEIYQHKPSPLPATRQILFYHKHDPYYEFTNFSPFSVTYNGKEYPTAEHLFQSFKVLHFLLIYESNTYGPSHSSKTIIPLWRSTSEHALKDQASLSQKHADSRLKCGQTGSK